MIIMPTNQALPHREARSDGVYAPRKGDQHELFAQQLLVCAEHLLPLDARFNHIQKVCMTRLSICEWEVIVQGDEGPVGGVAQVIGCHGVTVGHQEKEEVKVEQEVEGEKEEETLKERCTWMTCG